MTVDLIFNTPLTSTRVKAVSRFAAFLAVD